jgi:hypothetical protein
MNRFKIKLYPEKSKTDEINLEDTLLLVKDVAKEYSSDGKRASNRKWIEDDSITICNDTIEFILASDAWLEFPTKAIRNFISKLSKHSPYSELVTASGRVFKGESEYLEEEINEVELSDEQTLIEVTKLFFRENEENRRKIDMIKRILGGQKDAISL